MSFSLDEIDRYERQILLPEWGAAGQERVRAATVTLAGRGAAAEMAARYLAGAGVGRLAVSTSALRDIAAALNPHVDVTVVDGAPPPGVAARAIVSGSHAPTRSRIDLTVARDDHAAGCALALESLKAILDLPHRAVADAVLVPEPA